jgi:hypothetical protein
MLPGELTVQDVVGTAAAVAFFAVWALACVYVICGCALLWLRLDAAEHHGRPRRGGRP